MFINKANNLVITQREHAKLAGNIALYWGNDEFKRPTLPFSDFIEGITFHQNGYKWFDTYQVGAGNNDELLNVLTKDFEANLNTEVSTLVNMFHQYRLANRISKKINSLELENLSVEFKKEIDEKLKISNYSEVEFLWADKIVNMCDRISFDFSIGAPIEEIFEIYPKISSKGIVKIKFQFDGSNLKLDKWPFQTQLLKFNVMGFEVNTYPNELIPHLLQFELSE